VRGPPLAGYEQFSFAADQIVHPVYYSGHRGARSLLVLPEIAGMSPGLLLFADRLINAGFRVHIPWLFGSFGKRAPVRNALRLCISREFANLRAGVSPPITRWLRALIGHISLHDGQQRVGVIGMCLTGAFAIPLVIDPRVPAAVAAQPSVPLSPLYVALGVGPRSSLGALNVAASDIDAARARLASGEARLLALRCRADRICPAAKIERLRSEFPIGLEVREYGEAHDRNVIGERPHATFTKEYRVAPDASDDHHSRRALADLLAFFERHL
jgi:dienelactone hydrolase